MGTTLSQKSSASTGEEGNRRRFIVASIITAIWVVLAAAVELVVTVMSPRLPDSLMVHFGAGRSGLTGAYPVETSTLIAVSWAAIGVFTIVAAVNIFFALRGRLWPYIAGLFVCMILPLLLAGVTASIIWQLDRVSPATSMPSEVRSFAFAISMVFMVLGLASMIAIPRRVVERWYSRHGEVSPSTGVGVGR